MGCKIFVSYKYADNSVRNLSGYSRGTVRDYVTYLQENRFSGDDLNKAESDNEDLSDFKADTIRSKLKEKIWDSSITVVLVSPCMMEKLKRQDDQWIPWEISYSLRTQIRNKRRSHPNALIAVVLPDIESSYEYFLTYWSYKDKNKKKCVVKSINNNNTFDIIKNNMFNQKNPNIKIINGKSVYFGKSSYMITVKWKDFITETDKYINEALKLRDEIANYTICKKIIKDN